MTRHGPHDLPVSEALPPPFLCVAPWVAAVAK